MTETTLLKRSPLAAAYRRHGARFESRGGWEVAVDGGNVSNEQSALTEGCVLADWSHCTKIGIRGKSAEAEAARLDREVMGLARLRTVSTARTLIGRLTDDELLVLAPAEDRGLALGRLPAVDCSVLDRTGALACIALAGPRRDEVLERSCAVNLRRDRVGPGSVLQASFHFVHCTFFRTDTTDILVPTRDLAESLFDALVDVGERIGLRVTGVDVLDTPFYEAPSAQASAS